MFRFHILKFKVASWVTLTSKAGTIPFTIVPNGDPVILSFIINAINATIGFSTIRFHIVHNCPTKGVTSTYFVYLNVLGMLISVSKENYCS